MPEPPLKEALEITFEKFQLFLIFVVPGLVAIKTYDLFLPRRRNLANALVEAILYSLVNLAVVSLLFLPFDRRGGEGERFFNLLPLDSKEEVLARPYPYIGKMFLCAGVVPALLAWLTYKFRTSKAAFDWIGFDHPHRNGWEHFVLKKMPCFMLFHLKPAGKDGEAEKDYVGGYFGRESYAATYPREPEVYVERLYEITKHGTFGQPIEDSLGTVIKLTEIERVEFFRATYPAASTRRWWHRLKFWRWHQTSSVPSPPTHPVAPAVVPTVAPSAAAQPTSDSQVT